MHFVPIIPQPKTGVEERFEVKGVAAPGAVKPVAGRTSSPPPLVYAHVQQGASEIPQPHLQTHKRRAGDRPETVDQGERRLACRRFQHLPILEELRSLVDRRRHKRRKADPESHIDVEA